MSARYKHTSQLADEMNIDEAQATTLLKDKRVPIVDGWFDNTLWEAVMRETYVAGKRRLASGLSPRLGLGCVHALLDPLDIAVSVHHPRGAQWLMLRSGDLSAYCKWHYAGLQQRKKETCQFTVTNFLDDDKAATHYLFTCFEGPVAWVLKPSHLKSYWTSIQSGKKVTGVALRTGYEEHEGGSLILRLSTTTSPHLLKDKKQFGF